MRYHRHIQTFMFSRSIASTLPAGGNISRLQCPPESPHPSPSSSLSEPSEADSLVGGGGRYCAPTVGAGPSGPLPGGCWSSGAWAQGRRSTQGPHHGVPRGAPPPIPHRLALPHTCTGWQRWQKEAAQPHTKCRPIHLQETAHRGPQRRIPQWPHCVLVWAPKPTPQRPQTCITAHDRARATAAAQAVESPGRVWDLRRDGARRESAPSDFPRPALHGRTPPAVEVRHLQN